MAQSCDANPQFTDWVNEPGFKKIVYATAPQGGGPGLNYLDYGKYVPPGSDPNVTPAVGTTVSSGNTEPCYKFFVDTKVGRDQILYAMPNPDARRVRTDCRYDTARINGAMVTGPNGTLFTQDNFPHDQCGVDTTAVGCPVDADDNTDSVVTCLQNCQVGTLHNTHGEVKDNGSTVLFQLGNTRIRAPKNQTGTSFQSVVYNSPTNPKFESGTPSVDGLFDGKMCTFLDDRGGGDPRPRYENVMDFSSNDVGRSPVTLSTTGSSICKQDHGLDTKESSIIHQAPKYLDTDNAMKCCQAPTNAVTDPQWQQICQYTAFDNISGGTSGACIDLFQNYCMNYWGDVNSCPNGAMCNNFIQHSDSSEAITATLFNYITNINRSGPSGSYQFYGNYAQYPQYNPQDYISYGMRDQKNSPSEAYYLAHQCTVRGDYTCDASDGTYQVSGPCCRDDSLDPFFSRGVPQMCGAKPGACSSILPTFCAQFTRDQLGSDKTLANMCGCYLYVSGQTPDQPPRNQLGENPSSQMTMQGKTPVDANGKPISPYYTSIVEGPSCDPVCRGASVKSTTSLNTDCGSTCVIDGFTVNAINSTVGDIDVSQMCPANTNGAQTSCYIANSSVNAINSNVGPIVMNQQCSTCYTYTDGDPSNNATCVSCGDLNSTAGCTTNGGDPTTPTDPTQPTTPTTPTSPGTGTKPTPPATSDTSSGIGAWFKKHSTFLLILALVIIAIIVISYITKSTNSTTIETSDMGMDVGGDGYYDI